MCVPPCVPACVPAACKWTTMWCVCVVPGTHLRADPPAPLCTRVLHWQCGRFKHGGPVEQVVEGGGPRYVVLLCNVPHAAVPVAA